MVIICLMMANNNLVGGRPTPLQNDGGVKSLGMMTFHSQSDGKNHPVMFQRHGKSVLICARKNCHIILKMAKDYEVS